MNTLDLRAYSEAERAPSPQTARRAFVVYHAGEIYDKNCVRWYSAKLPENQERLLKEYHNIGDSVVYDSTLKLLQCDEYSPIDPNNVTDKMIDVINSEFSYGLIRGSNYLHSAMDWGNLASFISRLKVPIVAPGIGMQAPLGVKPHLSDAAIKIVRLLAEHSTSLGVRGDITAEALWHVGVRNVRVVGCPSVFRRLKSRWEVDSEKLAHVQNGPLDRLKVSFTLRREIGPGYVTDVRHYLGQQKELIKQVASSTEMTLFAQGELFEKFFWAGRRDLFWPLYKELMETGWAVGADDWIVDVYRKCLFYSDDIPVFVNELSKADLATGYRVHGVLPSMANGVPGVLVDYDARTHELIDTFGIPSVAVDEATLDRVLETARTHDYGRTQRKYRQVWSEMRTFLQENGVVHAMSDSPGSEQIQKPGR
jgi:hypothetical protein